MSNSTQKTTSTQSILQVMDAFNKRMEQFEGELHKTLPEGGTNSGLVADFAAFKTFTVQILREFQSQLGLLMQNVDNIEMNSRRKFLIFHGIPEDKKEDTKALVTQTITQHFKLERFSENSINRCQRIGQNSKDKPRPILVKFRDYDMKNKLWSSKTSLKGTSITLSEFLTKPRHDAFMEARRLFGVKSCWTRDGAVYILVPGGKRHRILSLADLHKIAPSKPGLQPSPALAMNEPVKAAETSTGVKKRRGAAPSLQVQHK